MILVGIDVAKDKHDCFIMSSEGEILANVFTISNSMEGFVHLLQRIHTCTNAQDTIKVGLEATGHYSYNILGFLLDSGLTTYVLNPLHTNLYRKSLSLRKTKTDRVDARTIAAMLMSDVNLKPYTGTAYHNEELKSLTRYRFDKVRERAKLKSSIARLVNILFPELEKLVSTIHIAAVYSLLSEFPGAQQIADAHLTTLKNLLHNASRGRYGRDKAIAIRDAAKNSIGSRMPAKSLELRHTIRLIGELTAEIEESESTIQDIMNELHSPITTIPGIGFRITNIWPPIAKSPTARTPPIQAVPTAPLGATHIDCVTPNTILLTVSGADVTSQYIFNGPVAYESLETALDSCVIISGTNLVADASDGTFGSFPPGTPANTGPAVDPYPGVFPDFTYVLPDPSKYTPIDGEFTLQNTMNDAMSNEIGAWWRISDHTAGNETGRMIVVNEDNPGNIIFRTAVSVNVNTTYLFSTWILNLFRVEGYPGPEFAVRILDKEGNALYDSPLGFEIPVSTQFPVWKEIGGVINSRENNELVIEFFSQGEAVVGDDFAIDDIALREVQLPDFDLIKTEDRSTAAIGDVVTYTVTLTNICTQPLQNVRFTDYIPAGLAFVPGSVVVNNVPNADLNPLIGFTVPDIDGDTTLQVSFRALVSAVPTPNPAINRASVQYVYTPVAGGILDSYQLTSNDVALLVEVPATEADLSITKIANTRTMRPCDTVVYTITVSNNGPDAAQNVVLSDLLASALLQPSFSANNGITWQPWDGSYDLGVLGSGGVRTIHIRAIVSGSARGEVVNTAHVGSSTPDPNPDNNYASERVNISLCVTFCVCCVPCVCDCSSRRPK